MDQSSTPASVVDPKQLSRDGYNKAASRYLEWSLRFPSPRLVYLEKVFELMQDPAHANVLELGCGAGIPATKALAEKCGSVVANDISSTQIALAKEKLSDFGNVRFDESDMATLSFDQNTFDAVTGFFSLIHLPREEQRTLIGSIQGWLKPGGLFLCCLPAIDAEQVIQENWLGMRGYWSSFGTEKNLAIIKQAGLEIVESKVSEEKGDATFLWVIAKKPEVSQPRV